MVVRFEGRVSVIDCRKIGIRGVSGIFVGISVMVMFFRLLYFSFVF